MAILRGSGRTDEIAEQLGPNARSNAHYFACGLMYKQKRTLQIARNWIGRWGLLEDLGILGIVCTQFVRKPGTHGNL